MSDKIVFPAVERVKDYAGYIRFKLTPTQETIIRAFILDREYNKKKPAYYKLTIEPPFKPRTTGWKSQNHRINGFIQQIAMATGNSFSAVKERMKELAIDRGYPIEILPDGSIKPKSESEISTIEAGYLIDTIEQFAAEWGIELVEDDGDVRL